MAQCKNKGVLCVHAFANSPPLPAQKLQEAAAKTLQDSQANAAIQVRCLLTVGQLLPLEQETCGENYVMYTYVGHELV